MNIGMILDMAASAGSRSVITVDDRSLSAADLLDRARRAAPRFHEHPAVLYLGTNHLAYPVALFGAVLAGVPFVPLNYRLGDAQLSALLERHPGALILRPEDLDALVAVDPAQPGPLELPTPWDADSVAVILYTSGTTSAPKAALLRHRHLMAYLLNTVEFGAAATTDATLVSVPPYHIAGLTNLLSNLYAGRRVVYLSAFDPAEWLATVRRERITQAMLVPTMLARIVGEVEGPTRAPRPWRRWPTAAPGCRARSWTARFGCSPRPVSSTPTDSPRPRLPSRSSGRRITVPPPPPTTRSSATGSARWVVPFPASSSRSAVPQMNP